MITDLSHLVVSQQHVVSRLQLILSLVQLLHQNDMINKMFQSKLAQSHLSEQVLLQLVILDQSPPPELPHFVVKSVLLSPHQSLRLLSIHLFEVLFVLEQGWN